MSRSALLQIPQNMQCRNNMQCREGQPGENMQQKESMGKTHCWELSRPAVAVIMEPTNTTVIFFMITILLMIIIIKSMVLAVWRCKLKWCSCSMLQSNWIHCIYKIKPALSISHPHHKSSFIVDIITNIIVIIISPATATVQAFIFWAVFVLLRSSLSTTFSSLGTKDDNWVTQ